MMSFIPVLLLQGLKPYTEKLVYDPQIQSQDYFHNP